MDGISSDLEEPAEGDEEEVERGQKWVKGIKYKMMNGNQTSGRRHSICIQII